MIKEAILVTIAAASLHLGTIHESQGSVSSIFWMRNNGDDTVRIIQTYPSCGCTTISFLPPGSIAPGDSLAVSVGFNPANRGGDFYETATILMTSENDTVRKVLSIEGVRRQVVDRSFRQQRRGGTHQPCVSKEQAQQNDDVKIASHAHGNDAAETMLMTLHHNIHKRI